MIIDINGNKITNKSKCIEHHPDGDTYVSRTAIVTAKLYPNNLYYTRLSEGNSTRRTRKYTEFKYKMKNDKTTTNKY